MSEQVCNGNHVARAADERCPACKGEGVVPVGPHECGWTETARQFANDVEFWRGLVYECAKHLGPEVFIADDGSVSDSPLALKVPELVAKLAAPSPAATSGVPLDTWDGFTREDYERKASFIATYAADLHPVFPAKWSEELITMLRTAARHAPAQRGEG